MSIHILDRYTDKIKDYLTNKPDKKIIIEDLHTRNIESHSETYDFTVDYAASENIQPRDRVLIPDEEIGQYREFVVDETDVDTYTGETEIKTVASYLEDLEKGRPIEPFQLDQYTTEQAVEYALTYVDWEVGTVEYGGFRTISWTGVNSPYELLKIIANRFDLQLDFTIEIDGNEISRRLVHLREKTALFDGKEVRRGKDLENLQIKRTSTDVVTALLALAPEPEEGEERITAIVVDDEAQAQYGREQDYIWGVYEPESDDQNMTKSRLETLARTQLNKVKNPKTDYTIDAVDLEQFLGHEKVRIGDKIRIKDDLQEPYFYADATVKEVKRSIFDPLSKSYVLGDVTEYTREDITKIFEKFRALLSKKMTETQSNIDNIVTIIDTAVERRIFKQPNPPENPINGQLWMDTSNPDKPVLMEYFNGQWIVRISAVTDPEDIGAISRAEAIYESILAVINSFEHLHLQTLTEANQIKLNKYLNQANIDNIDAKLQVVVNTYGTLKVEMAKYSDAKSLTLEQANYISDLMLAYTNALRDLKEVVTTAQNYAMEHLAILQSQYSDEKYTEALEEVAGKFGLTVEDGKLIGNTVLLDDLTNTKNELQSQLDAAKETLGLLESSNTSNETSISILTQEITNLEGLIASKVSQSDYDLLDKTVTDMSTEVSQTAEAVSTKADKSYVDTVKGTVENHSLSITEHAEGIDTLITKTNTHDGQITDVTNIANETAEGLEQTITKVTEAEGAITQAQADIVTNTKEIGTKLATATYTVDKEGIVSRLDAADSERTQLSNEIKDRVTLTDYSKDKTEQTGRISTLETSVTQNGKAITLKASQDDLDSVERTLSTKQSQLEVRADGIESSVEGLSDDLKLTNTKIEQTADSITSRVANISSNRPNILPYTDFTVDSENWGTSGHSNWYALNTATKLSLSWDNYLLGNNSSSATADFIGIYTPVFTQNVASGRPITLSFLGAHPSQVESFNRIALRNMDAGTFQWFSSPGSTVMEYTPVDQSNASGDFNHGLYTLTVTPNFSGKARFLIGGHISGDPTASWLRINNVKVEKADNASAYTPSSNDANERWSQITQTTDSITSEVGKKVGNNEIISKINQSSEKITIDANKINISGQSINIGANPAITGLNTSVGTAQSTANTAKSQADAARVGANIAKSINDAPSSVNINADRINLTAGSSLRLAVDGVNSLGNASNMLKYSMVNEGNLKYFTNINGGGNVATSISTLNGYKYFLVRANSSESPSYVSVQVNRYVTPLIKWEKGKNYKLSFKARKSSRTTDFRYTYIMRNDGANQSIGAPTRITPSEGTSENLYEFDITPNWSSEEGYLLIGLTGETTGYWMRIRDIMLQEGTVATPYQPHSSEVVGTNNVVSAIEMDESGVSISGNKISLTGTAEFNSAFKGRGLTAIDGGKIETVQMTARRIKIVTTSGREVMTDGYDRSNRAVSKMTPHSMSNNARIGASGSSRQYIVTESTSFIRADAFVFSHTARYLMVNITLNTLSSAIGMRARLRWRKGSTDIYSGQASETRQNIQDEGLDYDKVLVLDMGEPLDYGAKQMVYVDFRTTGAASTTGGIRVGSVELTDFPPAETL